MGEEVLSLHLGSAIRVSVLAVTSVIVGASITWTSSDADDATASGVADDANGEYLAETRDPLDDGLNFSKMLGLLPNGPPPRHHDFPREVACVAVEHGIPWLRIRKHLQPLFTPSEDEPWPPVRAEVGSLTSGEVRSLIALAAIEEDPEIPHETLARFAELDAEVDRGSFQCEIGAASLRLLAVLACILATLALQTVSDFGNCNLAFVDLDVYFSFDGPQHVGLGNLVRGMWPIHFLIATIVHRLALTRHEVLHNVEGRSPPTVWAEHAGKALWRALRAREWPLNKDAATVVTEVLEVAAAAQACLGPNRSIDWCPYRAPLDSHLCGIRRDWGMIAWAVHPTRCLDSSGGKEITMWDCACGRTYLSQRFLLPETNSGVIRLASNPTKCLAVKGNNVDNRTPIEIADCVEDDPSHLFLIPLGRTGEIRLAYRPHMCFDVKAGSTANANPLQLFQCGEQHPNQQFDLSSSIESDHVPPCAHSVQPHSTVLRGDGAPLAASSAFITLAAASLSAASLAACEGFDAFCSKTPSTNDQDTLWEQAAEALSTAVAGTAATVPVVQMLAGSPWPIAQLLCEAANHAHEIRLKSPGPSEAPIRNGAACACDLRLWSKSEARTLAAALRVVELLEHVFEIEPDEHLNHVVGVLRSADATLACASGKWKNQLRSVFAIVGHVWGMSPVYADGTTIQFDPSKLMAEDIVLAKRIAGTSSSEWDANVCLPGVATLALVCSSRELEQNEFADWMTFSGLVGPLTTVLSQCGDGGVNEHYERFFQDWPGFFFKPDEFSRVFDGLLIRSERWRSSSSGIETAGSSLVDPISRSSSVSLRPSVLTSACTGVWEVNEHHACHGGIRATRASDLDNSWDGVPRTRILGTGMMKAGSTFVWQLLGAATQLSLGLDCSSSQKILPFVRRQAPLWKYLEACYDEVFRWELSKDPLATPLAARLADAWPSISNFGGPLKVYFLVRNPFDFTLSMLRHLGLKARVQSQGEQHFDIWSTMPLLDRFTPNTQAYLDVSSEGLRYSGYVDAIVQRWVLTVDVYLACPKRFELVRYEDFVLDPVGQTRDLLVRINMSNLWLPGAEQRVAHAASVRYQSSTNSDEKRDFLNVFGEDMLARLQIAVRSRLELVGYGDTLQTLSADEIDSKAWRPIDTPPLPVQVCS
eukprot:TRINITY_DN6216_c2_g1_i1.p1 TRINITY_DN6216_c2_g1~~TRINITY_DN6216_c2_g1_i1.p1  ORF type:complete len:1157 (+),score=129.87 TRINITY_DN6216_c2_g1_i1:55-3525(+)